MALTWPIVLSVLFAALLLQLLGLLLALRTGVLERLLLGLDRGFEILQLRQVTHQGLHALEAVLLEVL